MNDPLHIRLRDIPDAGLALDLALPRELLADALTGEQTDLAHDRASVTAEVRKLGQNVFVRGVLEGSLELSCSRCLAPAVVAVDVPLHVTFTPPLPAVDGDEGDEADGDLLADEDYAPLSQVKGEWIVDLRELLREQLVLALPIKPLCKEDCAGLCARCGKDLNAGPCGCPPEPHLDPRFAALAALKGKPETEPK